MEHRKGVRGNQDILIRLATQLHLQSKEQLRAEFGVLEKARSQAKLKDNKDEENYLSQILSLLSAMESEVLSEKNSARRLKASDPDKIRPPKEYCCPLSLELMADPVILASGQTFERVFVERWLEQGNLSCPVTKHVLSHKSLIPNFALRSSIATWCKGNGVPIPQSKKLPPNATIRGPGVVDFHNWLREGRTEKGHGERAPQAPLDTKSNLKSRNSQSQGVSRRTVRSVRFVSPAEAEAEKKLENLPEAEAENPQEITTEEAKEKEGEKTKSTIEGVENIEEAPSAEGEEKESSQKLPVYETMKMDVPQDPSVSPSSQGTSPEGSGRHQALQGSFSPASVNSEYSTTGSGTPPVDILPVRSVVHGGSRSPLVEAGTTAGSMIRSASGSHISAPEEDLDDLEESPAILLRRSPFRSPEPSGGIGSFPASPASSYSISSGSTRVTESPARSVPSFSPSMASSSRGDADSDFRPPLSREMGIKGEQSGEQEIKLSEAEIQEMQDLVKGLKEGSSQQRHVAAIRIRQLAKSSEECRRALGEKDAIAPLVRLLESSETVLVESALFALLNLSISDSNKDEMVRKGSIRPLVSLLRAHSEITKEGAVGVLFSLSALDEYKLGIGAAGAIPGLVDVLVMGTKRAKCDAICAIYNLSLAGHNKGLLINAGVLKPVLYIARKGPSVFGNTMVEKSVAVMSNLAWIPEGQSVIVRSKGIPILCYLVENGSEKAKEHAVACLLRLCVDSVIYKNMVYKEDVLTPLMLLSKFGTQRAKVKVGRLLY